MHRSVNDYIGRNLQTPDKILSLANRWGIMVQALQKAGVCHGDLQHGNILIVKGDFRLIDYDGMFVPALSGQTSHEVGHRNYQHPLRKESDFGSYLDNFAAWVIYTSLICLGIDRTLWRRVGAGDEFILFKKEDFTNPDVSRTFSLLTKHSDYRLQALASLFQSLLFLMPQQIPSLDNQPSVPTQPIVQNLSAIPDWLSGHLGETSKIGVGLPSSLQPHPSTFSTSSPTDASWVIDFIQPPSLQLRRFSSSVIAPRITFWGSIATVVGLFSYWILTNTFDLIVACYAGLFLFVVNIVIFKQWYKRDTVFDELNSIRTQESEIIHSRTSVEQEMKKVQTDRSNIIKLDGETRTSINKQTSELRKKEKEEIDRIQLHCNQFIASLNNQLLTLNREEIEALTRNRDTIQFGINNLTGRISTFSKVHTEELANTLTQKQNQFLRSHLALYSISNASITGIGDKLKARLRLGGVSTAADIVYWKVTAIEGIGANKGIALVTWRDALIAQVQNRVPKSLSTGEIDTINSKYLPQLRLLQNQLDDAKRNLVTQEESIKAQFANKRKQLNSQQAAAQNKRTQDLQSIQERYAQQYASLSERLITTGKANEAKLKKVDAEIQSLQKRLFDSNWQLTKTRHELKGFENITFKKYLVFVTVSHIGRRGIQTKP